MSTAKILFICLGNICRSPAAEGIMKKMILTAGLQESLVCESAGTSGHHQGSLPDSRMIDHALKRGYQLTSRSRVLTLDDYEKFDFLVVMDKQNFENVRKLDRQGRYQGKIVLMGQFCSKMTAEEVPDPYFGEGAGFERVLDILEDACQGLLEKIRKEGARFL